MPFKSKAQWKWMFAAEERGEVPKGTARRWAHETPQSYSKLPARKKSDKKKQKKKASVDIADVLNQIDEFYKWRRLQEKRASLIQAMPDREFIAYIAGAINRRYMEKKAGLLTQPVSHAVQKGVQWAGEVLANAGEREAQRVLNEWVEDAAKQTAREMFEREGKELIENAAENVAQQEAGQGFFRQLFNRVFRVFRTRPKETGSGAGTGVAGSGTGTTTGAGSGSAVSTVNPSPINRSVIRSLERDVRDLPDVLISEVNKVQPGLFTYRESVPLGSQMRNVFRTAYGLRNPQQVTREFATHLEDVLSKDINFKNAVEKFRNTFRSRKTTIANLVQKLKRTTDEAEKQQLHAQILKEIDSLRDYTHSNLPKILSQYKDYLAKVNLPSYEKNRALGAFVEYLGQPDKAYAEVASQFFQRTLPQSALRGATAVAGGTAAVGGGIGAYHLGSEVVRGYSDAAKRNAEQAQKKVEKPQDGSQSQPPAGGTDSGAGSDTGTEKAPTPAPSNGQLQAINPPPPPPAPPEQKGKDDLVKDILRNMIFYGGGAALISALLSKLLGLDVLPGAQLGAIAGAGLGFGGRYFDVIPDVEQLFPPSQ